MINLKIQQNTDTSRTSLFTASTTDIYFRKAVDVLVH